MRGKWTLAIFAACLTVLVLVRTLDHARKGLSENQVRESAEQPYSSVDAAMSASPSSLPEPRLSRPGRHLPVPEGYRCVGKDLLKEVPGGYEPTSEVLSARYCS
jgi:hypothetical protein